jgi:hypothetical protein
MYNWWPLTWPLFLDAAAFFSMAPCRAWIGTEFYCTFVLKSLSAKVEEVQIGFPVDSQFAGYSRNKSPLISAKESDKWVSDYSFIARETTYHVSFVRRKKEAASEVGELFTWEMNSHQRRRERSPSSTNCR